MRTYDGWQGALKMNENRLAAGWLEELFQRNDTVVAQVAQSVRSNWGAVQTDRHTASREASDSIPKIPVS